MLRIVIRALARLQSEIPVLGSDETHRDTMLGWLKKGMDAFP